MADFPAKGEFWLVKMAEQGEDWIGGKTRLMSSHLWDFVEFLNILLFLFYTNSTLEHSCLACLYARQFSSVCPTYAMHVSLRFSKCFCGLCVNPLRSLWCCSDTMDPLGPFWALAPLIIGLEPWNQMHLKENWILRKVMWFSVTSAERPLKEVARPSKYVSSRKLNLNLSYIR